MANISFDANYYYEQKLNQLQEQDSEQYADWSVADVALSFNENGLTAEEHYEQYGAAEGLNPSAEFDTQAYLSAKLGQLQEQDSEQYADWTVEDVAQAFEDNGLSPLAHFNQFGQDEGLEATPAGATTPSGLTEALNTLSDAETAQAEFLGGIDGLNTDLDENTGENGVDVAAGEATEGNVTTFYSKASSAVGTDLTVTNFADKSADVQDGYISSEQSTLQAKVADAKADAVAGTEALLNSAAAREEQLLAAVKGANAAEAEVDAEFAAFNAANTAAPGSKDNVVFMKEADYDASVDYSSQFLVIDGTLYTGTDGTSSAQPLSGLTSEDATRADQFKAAVDAKADADDAQTAATDALTGVLADIIKAEQDAFDVNEDDLTTNVLSIAEDAGSESVTVNLKANVKTTAEEGGGETSVAAAPDAAALATALGNQSDFADLVATFEQARDLNTTLEGLKDDVTDAREAIENDTDDAEAPGLGVQLLDNGANFGTGDDVYLFNAENDGGNTLTGFGADGEDNIFFGQDFSLVEVNDGGITGDNGDANALEIFWEQNGNNVDLFIEAKSFAGNGSSEADLTQVTLNGVDAADLQDNLANGFLTAGTAADIA